MADRVVLDLFVEDAAHERLFSALIRRIAREEGRHVVVRTVQAKGGHGKVLHELDLFQRVDRPGAPDVLVVGIDANCKGWNPSRTAIKARIASSLPCVIACPDPHVERWYLADPTSLASALNVKPSVPRRKCGRDEYKTLLLKILRTGGNTVVLGGIEFADEIVDAMDLFRAGKAEPSLKHFIEGLRARFK